MGVGWWYRLLTVPEDASSTTPDLVNYIQATSDARMRHGGAFRSGSRWWWLNLYRASDILAAMGGAISQARYNKGEDYERAALKQPQDELNLEEVLIQNEILLIISLELLV